MPVILFNKPFGVLSQFTGAPGRATLAAYLRAPSARVAGRLDFDSEGLLLLTDHGPLQARITQPASHLPKTYWVQVDGQVSLAALKQLRAGVKLSDGSTRPSLAEQLDAEPAGLWPRVPPIRHRAAIPASWLAITITEGRNRQIRRMTAAVGFPTLRLVRVQIGPWTLDGLAPGAARELTTAAAWSAIDKFPPPGPRR